MLSKTNIFRNPNLATRLLFWFGLVGLLPLTVVTIISYVISSQSLTDQVTTALEVIAESKANQIELYASERQKDVSVLSRQPIVADALEKYAQAVNSGGIDSPEYLAVEAEYRSYLTDYTQAYEYQDLFLISADGNAVFSVQRGEDLGSNYYTGIYKGTELAKVFVQSQTLLTADLSDFAYYPATNEPAAFLAAPVMKDGNLIGAVALQINNTALYTTVNDFTGLGLTGEVVVGSKLENRILYLTPLRNDPYAAFRRSVVIGSDTGLPVQESIKGLAGSGVAPDYRGKEVISSWRYLPGLRWGMVVKIDTEEAFASIAALRNAALGLGIASLFVVFLIAVFVSRTISRPIVNLTDVAKRISGGDVNMQAKVETTDEIGTLAGTFNTMTAQLREFIATLETRVADRTKALATAGEVSRRISNITNQQQLAVEVVTQLQTAFNYYHAHIYLMDNAGENLLLAGGTGDAGKILLERGHSIPKGRGLVGRAADTKQVVLVADTSKAEGWLPNPLLTETKSEIAVPIIAGDQVYGVIDVQNNAADSLTQQDADMISSIANQVGIALQNIASAESVVKRARELEAVAAISTIASSETIVEKMLEQVVHLTQRRFGLYHAHVFLYRPDMDDMQIIACGYREGDVHEGTHGTTAIPLTQQQSLVARAARSRQPVIVNDVRSDPGWLPNPLLPDTAAELAVPMIVGDQLIGVLDVQAEQINAFTDADANIQTTLASQIAVAVQNARSLEAAQAQAERESALNLIGQRIQGTTTVDAALQIAVRELGHALGMKPAMVTIAAASATDAQAAS